MYDSIDNVITAYGMLKIEQKHRFILKTSPLSGNNADPDRTPCSSASDPGLHCVLRRVCPST